MQRYLPLLSVLLIVTYGLYNAKTKKETKKRSQPENTYTQHLKEHHTSHAREELLQLHTDTYIQHYIIRVINHGSTLLRFKKDEIMEGGYAPKEDAHKIACYVMELSGKACPTPYPADAAGFYTSVCGGCHGNDGKGLGGTYPDLTQHPLLGIQHREELLRSKVAE